MDQAAPKLSTTVSSDTARQEPLGPQELHSRGIELAAKGDHKGAATCFAQAVAKRPGVPAFHVDLAEAYRNLGELSRAAACCQMALALRPDYSEAHNTFGLTLQGMGNLPGAVEQFRRALATKPNMVSALNNLGVVLQELGQIDEAITFFKKVVDAAPGLFRPRTNLGMALVNAGRAEEALPQLQEATRLQPDMAVLHRNLGDALKGLNREEEARAAYLETTRLEPERAENYRDVGLTLVREGQFGGAVPWLKLAAERAPEHPAHWQNLAELYGERDEFTEAIPCWERVLTLSPVKQAATYNSLGWALQEEGRLAEARENYRIALQLQPDLAPAPLHLGAIHEQPGELTEAEAAFRAALQVQPRFPLPYARLATLLRGKLPAEDLAALEERLNEPSLHPQPRAHLLFGLAHVLDARGDYAQAAECLRQANALSVELDKGEREYVPADHQRLVDGLVRAFDTEFFARTAGMGLDRCRPVFVFGLPRLGTTLIEQVLASHPQIHGAGELRLARQSFEEIPRLLDRHGPPIEAIPDLDADAIRRLAEEHLERLTAFDGGQTARIVNKMPDNKLYLGLLAVLFPNATFIHCRRNLRDVAVSCWMTDFRSIRWSNDTNHIATRFAHYRRIMAHWREVLLVTVHEVEYEETVGDLEGVAQRLIAACGQEWDPACLEFHRTQRSVRTASVTQVRQPIYTKSVARWKHYEPDLGQLFEELGRMDRVAAGSSESGATI